MLDYLYYKLYKSLAKSSLYDTAEFSAAIMCGGLIGVDFFIIDALAAKLHTAPYFFSGKNVAPIFDGVCIILAVIFFLATKRYKKIIKKYSTENDHQRVRGNTIIWIYVIISFLSIFAVGLFRPGQF